LSWSRNFGFQKIAASSRSSGRERGHGVVGVGGSSNGDEIVLISGRVGSSAGRSRVSDSENRGDSSIVPG
jgi:hypothetical protein